MDFIKSTIEYQSWGFNFMTLCFFITIFFSVLQGWSFWTQWQLILEKGGKSVSVTMFGYWCVYFLSFGIYGIYKHTAAFVLNGLLGFVCIPVLISLYRKKGFTKWEKKLLCIFPVTIPAVILAEPIVIKDLLVLVMLFGILFAGVLQPIEIWKKKDAESIDPKMILVFIVSAVFWFFYAIKIKNWPLIIFNPLSLVVLVTTFVLWLKYKQIPNPLAS